MTPSASATSPQPPRMAQAAWLELMKPAPVLATIEPVTATPMEMPNWRALAGGAPAPPTRSGGGPGVAGVGGARGAQVADVLAVEGVEEQEPAETGRHHDGDRDRAGKRRAAEEPQVDQGL